MDPGCSDRAAGGVDGAGVAQHHFFDEWSEGIGLTISTLSVAFAKSSAVAVEEVEGFRNPAEFSYRTAHQGWPTASLHDTKKL